MPNEGSHSAMLQIQDEIPPIPFTADRLLMLAQDLTIRADMLRVFGVVQTARAQRKLSAADRYERDWPIPEKGERFSHPKKQMLTFKPAGVREEECLDELEEKLALYGITPDDMAKGPRYA